MKKTVEIHRLTPSSPPPGREYLQELGIYDYRHRYYLPSIGRFLETDPMGLQTEGEKLSAGQKALFSPGGSAPEAFSSSEMNLFRYCGDDPVDRNDSLGLQEAIVAYAPRDYSDKELKKLFPGQDPKESRQAVASEERDTRNDVKKHTAAMQATYGKDKTGKDKVEYRDVKSKKDVENAAKTARVFLYAHGKETGVPRIRLGRQVVPNSSLPANVTAFGCNPTEGRMDADVIMQQIEAAVAAFFERK